MTCDHCHPPTCWKLLGRDLLNLAAGVGVITIGLYRWCTGANLRRGRSPRGPLDRALLALVRIIASVIVLGVLTDWRSTLTVIAAAFLAVTAIWAIAWGNAQTGRRRVKDRAPVEKASADA